jgi:hypothetical protein
MYKLVGFEVLTAVGKKTAIFMYKFVFTFAKSV